MAATVTAAAPAMASGSSRSANSREASRAAPPKPTSTPVTRAQPADSVWMIRTAISRLKTGVRLFSTAAQPEVDEHSQRAEPDPVGDEGLRVEGGDRHLDPQERRSPDQAQGDEDGR